MKQKCQLTISVQKEGKEMQKRIKYNKAQGDKVTDEDPDVMISCSISVLLFACKKRLDTALSSARIEN
jgi:hypothetical protein